MILCLFFRSKFYFLVISFYVVIDTLFLIILIWVYYLIVWLSLSFTFFPPYAWLLDRILKITPLLFSRLHPLNVNESTTKTTTYLDYDKNRKSIIFNFQPFRLDLEPMWWFDWPVCVFCTFVCGDIVKTVYFVFSNELVYT